MPAPCDNVRLQQGVLFAGRLARRSDNWHHPPINWRQIRSALHIPSCMRPCRACSFRPPHPTRPPKNKFLSRLRQAFGAGGERGASRLTRSTPHLPRRSAGASGPVSPVASRRGNARSNRSRQAIERLRLVQLERTALSRAGGVRRSAWAKRSH